MGGLSFGAPLILAGLLALPAIWWLLRLTPPRPQTEAFPPWRILERIVKREETPARSPWWLTLLRLLLAAAIIFALAAPILNPRENALAGDGPLAILMDNGWASAGDWDERTAAAEALIREAADQGRPVALAFSADPAGDATPIEAAAALERLAAAGPLPVPVDRLAAAERLSTALAGGAAPSLALLTDGLDSPGTAEAGAALAALGPAQTVLFRPSTDGLIALTGAENAGDALAVSATRPPGATGLSRPLRLLDAQGREIGRAELSFPAGDTQGAARFEVPVELRNDIARIEAEGFANAAEVRLVDDSFRRRKVAVISGEASDLGQPLLSPLNYITRAIEPFADVERAGSANLSVSVPRLLEEGPSVVILADIGVLPGAVHEALEGFVAEGGILLRFAGPRLAASVGEDTLVPVRLRAGERQLGGAMSWSQPQPFAPMPGESPFAGLAVPPDVTVTRQVLAEPSATLDHQVWANLSDGTPIVTAAARGAGTVVLVHTAADASWSNLPLSGTFVEMLRRIVALSRSGAAAPASGQLAPYRALDASGLMTMPASSTRPLVIEAGVRTPADNANPPGLYGSDLGFRALNLFEEGDTLAPFPAEAAAGATSLSYGLMDSTDLKPALLLAALALFALDAAALLWLHGGFSRMRRRLGPRGAAALPVLALACVLAAGGQAQAQEFGEVDTARALAATTATHLAYVQTGDGARDEISRQGLTGLSRFIAAKTALEPGEPMEVDLETDELSFFPVIYWPVDPAAQMPSQAAISRIDAYMKQGGTVLFDVEDNEMNALGGTVSAGQRRLRDILADLDIAPLEPVPADHVLTKAFYLLDDFPGRRTGSDLWVEASLRGDEAEARPASAGDGVSSIMITSNDFASAWAVDDSGMFVFPTDSADPAQREFAYRAGVNIVMYVLTGNYKADQVHVPALLERLGQ
ncbi:DUF4159 domain-containing protein [Aureimonas populi]|uniref:DUF4159 domain-containing protein n=1 Tax=Aureimonas populi TaxID=1701758 RepID=A0ABW5CJD4_9HYPH|nr:DUF4159 domain-containing protein [Aureimonas populi]